MANYVKDLAQPYGVLITAQTRLQLLIVARPRPSRRGPCCRWDLPALKREEIGAGGFARAIERGRLPPREPIRPARRVFPASTTTSRLIYGREFRNALARGMGNG